MLSCLGDGTWKNFYEPATRPVEISITRPFYPRVPGGTSKQHLLSGLGLAQSEDLLRRCDHATETRGRACEMFWTLGANQVGRAAIQGWQYVLAPAVREGSISIWPFDGDLQFLLAGGGIVVVEAYPAETYGHLGMPRNFGKRSPEARKSQARLIFDWCQGNGVCLDSQLGSAIDDGFGCTEAGEDRFDALIGLLGLVEVARDPSAAVVPDDHFVRNTEGWIVGMGLGPSGQPRAKPNSVAAWPTRHEPQGAPARCTSSERQQQSRLCPACQKKLFARWPWGWDGHAAHGCTGVSGETPADRKQAYRAQYLDR
jgi:hypothetical protein